MFWNLTDTGDERRLAYAPDGEDTRFEKVHCPLNPVGHNRLGRRISDLNLVLPKMEPEDFVWTWESECLVQEHVLYLFKMAGFTGYETNAVQRVRFANSLITPPNLWEIVVKGSAGMASLESGAKVLRVCPGCGATDYSRVRDSTKLIDVSQWDGSDFFFVKPHEGLIFVTDRVIQMLSKNSITGWRGLSLSEIQESLDKILP